MPKAKTEAKKPRKNKSDDGSSIRSASIGRGRALMRKFNEEVERRTSDGRTKNAVMNRLSALKNRRTGLSTLMHEVNWLLIHGATPSEVSQNMPPKNALPSVPRGEHGQRCIRLYLSAQNVLGHEVDRRMFSLVGFKSSDAKAAEAAEASEQTESTGDKKPAKATRKKAVKATAGTTKKKPAGRPAMAAKKTAAKTKSKRVGKKPRATEATGVANEGGGE